MSDPFAALGANIDAPSRMELTDGNDVVIRDKDGNPAYIDMLSPDSEPARAVDRQVGKAFTRKIRTGKAREVDDEDPIETQVEKLVAVTTGWSLVDPATRERLDVPFSPANARALYSSPKTGWIRRRAWTYHNNEANFMQRSAKD